MRIVAIAAITLALAACGQKAENKENTKVEGAKPPMEKAEGIQIDVAKLASKIDPVCEMDITDGVADTASYEGKLYGFCGTGCKEDFVKNPKQYIK